MSSVIIHEETLDEALAALQRLSGTTAGLDLAYVKDADGIQRLAEALRGNASLTSLELEESFVGDEGAKLFADALKVSTSLTTLQLVGGDIADEGSRHLAEALRANTSLTELGLMGNSIGDEGAGWLAQALVANGHLKTLDLRCNLIGAKGANRLAEALKDNTSLTQLQFEGNPLTPEGARQLLEALKPNTSLMGLSFALHHADALVLEAIVALLSLNKRLMVSFQASRIGPQTDGLQLLKLCDGVATWGKGPNGLAELQPIEKASLDEHLQRINKYVAERRLALDIRDVDAIMRIPDPSLGGNRSPATAA